ncbi:MAG: CHAD domain-containing protein [Gammaproteobacteria bacterium]|jgi:hypothetical protein
MAYNLSLEESAVHDARRHCKLIRALVRLVRPAFAHYRAENVWFRDLGRSLSLTHDATATIEAFDALMSRFEGIIHTSAMTPIRDRLEERRGEVCDARRLPL